MSISIDEIERQIYSTTAVKLLGAQIEQAYRESTEGTSDRVRCAFLMGALYEVTSYTKAREYYDELHRVAEALRDERALADARHVKAVEAFRTGDLRTGYRLEEESLTFATNSGHQFRIAHTHDSLGKIAIRFGMYADGLNHKLLALQLAQKHGFLRLRVRILSSLAELHLISHALVKASNYAEEAITVARRIDGEESLITERIRLATIKLELKEYGEVNRLVSDVRKTLPKENHSLWCVTHTLMGKVHEAKRRYEKAEAEFKTALKLADYPNAERVRSNVHVHLARLYLKMKKPRPALKESFAALADAETAQDIYVRKEALRAVHDAYKALNKYKEAHEYLERFNALVAESDTALLQSRLEYHALKSDFEQEKAKADMQTQQTELLRIRLEYKERELTEKMRHLITQAEAVRQFRNDLRSLLRRTPSDDPAAKDIRSRMSTFTENAIQWQEFEEKFREAFPDFREKLKAKHPDLSGQELRLCQLLRARLKSVEAAKLMIISERGVEQHRLRIRRKVGLKGKESLSEYLQRL